MRTINNITVSQAQQVLLLERNGKQSSLNKEDPRVWSLREYMIIRDKLNELLTREDPNLVPLETIKAGIKYKLNYSVEDLTDRQLNELIDLFTKGSIEVLHCILAVIATPVNRTRTFEQKAEDLLKANFLQAYAAGFYFLNKVQTSTQNYRLKRLREKVFGKQRTEIKEVIDKMQITLN